MHLLKLKNHWDSTLAKKMRKVEQGDFDVRIDTNRKDEIGWLSEVFNTMVHRIKMLIETTFKQELLTKEAQFKSLQAQIHPHFLYNTLDMINWRLQAEGHSDLSASVQALGKLLRYSVHEESEVTLSEELENCKDYLCLRQSNKDPVFTYSILSNGPAELRLPRLTLQPLVENAIIHGFRRRRSANHLEIRSYDAQDNRYCIEIEDNGLGMDEKSLDKVLQRLSEKDLLTENSTHLGIANVNKRIKFMYGTDSGISIDSTFGTGTTVRIIIALSVDDYGKNE